MRYPSKTPSDATSTLKVSAGGVKFSSNRPSATSTDRSILSILDPRKSSNSIETLTATSRGAPSGVLAVRTTAAGISGLTVSARGTTPNTTGASTTARTSLIDSVCPVESVTSISRVIDPWPAPSGAPATKSTGGRVNSSAPSTSSPSMTAYSCHSPTYLRATI